MENIYPTVILLLCELCVVNGECTADESDAIKCNKSLIEIQNARICYKKNGGIWWTATISCKNGTLNGPSSYTCRRTSLWNWSWSWKPSPNSSCVLKETTTSTGITITSTTGTRKTSTTSESTRDTSGSSVNNQNATTPISTITTPTHTTEAIATSVSATSNTQSVSVEDGETTREPTTKTTTDSTNWSDTSQSSSSKTPGLADDSDSVVAAAVSVSVVTVIAIAAVIAFLLWRRRRLKPIPAKESCPRTSITNRNYEDGHGLDRHISLLNMHTKDSVASDYAEIHPEETTGNLYQTIDSLPEDQAESYDGYGHLEIQTTQFIDKNYSHVLVNQTSGTALTDIMYAHTESALNEQVLNDNQVDADITYNRLETSPKTNKGKQIPEKEEGENDDAETEYNHAKAGLTELTSENKADTYSHLNTTPQKPLEYPQNGMNIYTQDSKKHNHENEPRGIVTERGIRRYESLNAKDGISIPEYTECIQNGKECGRIQVSPDGYETAVGTAHNYFILEPENEPSSNEASFRVVEGNIKETNNNAESGEVPYHPYFTLEKTET